MKYPFALFIAFLCLIYNCDGDLFEKTILLEEDQEIQLAVTAQLNSSDTIHSIFLTKTIAATDLPEYELVVDASVVVEVDGEIKSFLYNEQSKLYQHPTDFAFLPNSEFRLVISTPFFKDIQASQKLLAAANNLEIDTIGNLKLDDGSLLLSDGALSISFDDPRNTENYYILEVVGTGIGFDNQTRADGALTAKLNVNSDNTLFDYDGGKRLFLSDQFSDGTRIAFNFNYTAGLGWEKLNKIEVRLISTTKEGYLYQLTTDKFNDARFDRFAEPVISFNNIESGVGVFAVSNVHSVTIK